jgi:hypothetical protein
MSAILNIFRSGTTRNSHGKETPEYQANLTLPGKVYSKRCDEDLLAQFLRTRVGLNKDELARVFRALHSDGRALVGDVDFFPDSEAGGYQLEQMQDEY